METKFYRSKNHENKRAKSFLILFVLITVALIHSARGIHQVHLRRTERRKPGRPCQLVARDRA